MCLCVHIIVDNIMMRVFKSTVLNCNYLSGYSMKLFETRIYCSNFFFLWFDSFRLNGHAEKKSNSIITSSILMRICVHIVVDNIMTRVFKSTVLNCKYFGGFCMNLFQTWIYCTKFCVLPCSNLSSCGQGEKESQILS